MRLLSMLNLHCVDAKPHADIMWLHWRPAHVMSCSCAVKHCVTAATDTIMQQLRICIHACMPLWQGSSSELQHSLPEFGWHVHSVTSGFGLIQSTSPRQCWKLCTQHPEPVSPTGTLECYRHTMSDARHQNSQCHEHA